MMCDKSSGMKFDRFTPEWDADAKVECELPEHMERVERDEVAADRWLDAKKDEEYERGLALARDIADYEKCQRHMKALRARFGAKAIDTTGYQDLWTLAEQIKNRHGGMPPKLP